METPPKQSKSQHGSQLSAPKDKSARGGGGGGGVGNSGASTAITGGEFIVAKILGKKITRYEAQYHVKWEGYSVGEATWEPFSNLQHNVVRGRFDDKLKQWLRKHDDAGSAASRVSDIDREIAEWTSKQTAQKLKYAKNNEELRADRIEQELREFNKQQPRQSSQQPSDAAATQSVPMSAGAAVTPASSSVDLAGSHQLNSSLSQAAGVNGSVTPTPTGLATPSSNGLPAPSGMTPGSAGGPIGKSGSFRRNKRTSPYPEWVAVARKRLLTEKRNVLKIYSLSSINDVPCYKVQLDGLREPEYIPTVLVKQHHPSRVIEFYEDHLTVPSPSKNGKRIKLKDLFAEMQQQQQLQQQQQQQQISQQDGQSPTTTNSTAVTTQSTNNELEADQHMMPRSGVDGDAKGSQVTAVDSKAVINTAATMMNSSPARPMTE